MKSKFILAVIASAAMFFSNSLSAQWTEVGTGSDTIGAGGYDINAITVDASGNLYAAGQFKDFNGNQYVAKWNGTSWVELGSGTLTLGANGDILSICSDPAGNIYAAGQFTQAATGQAYVAKWDGTSWTELGAGQKVGGYFTQQVSMIVSDANGNIYAGGQIIDSLGKALVTKFDGTNWTRIGSSNMSGSTDVIAVDPNGDIYATGSFLNSSNQYYVSRYHGGAWAELGSLNMDDNALTMCIDASHNLYVGGRFQDATSNEYVAKWDGSSWSELGGATGISNANSGEIDKILADGSGNIFIGGAFEVISSGMQFVDKWNGSSWSNYGNLDCNNGILTMAMHGSDIYAAGAFTTDPNGQSGHYVAKYSGGNGSNGITAISTAGFKLSPNPSNGKFAIDLGQVTDASITLTDLSGKSLEVWQANHETTKACDMNQYAPGLYLVRIESMNGQAQTIKVVKD